MKRLPLVSSEFGGDGEIRTHGPNLGKVVGKASTSQARTPSLLREAKRAGEGGSSTQSS
jgi:hypothetical protein